MPLIFHGKEGVDGSSPSEGSQKPRKRGVLFFGPESVGGICPQYVPGATYNPASWQARCALRLDTYSV
jgi:hypothetical protein